MVHPDDVKPRKRNRLPTSAYSQSGSVWHVTMSVKHPSTRPMQAPAAAETVARVIDGSAEFTGAPIHLYTILPNHAHLLIEIGSRNLVEIVKSIKSFSTKEWWKTGGEGALWQRSFYDHGIRDIRDYDATIDYILDNPVKAGLVETWDAYPWIGGTILEGR